MPNPKELCFKTTTELARLIHRREVSVCEVMAAHGSLSRATSVQRSPSLRAGP
jgi:hypothetical protein